MGGLPSGLSVSQFNLEPKQLKGARCRDSATRFVQQLDNKPVIVPLEVVRQFGPNRDKDRRKRIGIGHQIVKMMKVQDHREPRFCAWAITCSTRAKNPGHIFLFQWLPKRTGKRTVSKPAPAIQSRSCSVMPGRHGPSYGASRTLPMLIQRPSCMSAITGLARHVAHKIVAMFHRSQTCS